MKPEQQKQRDQKLKQDNKSFNNNLIKYGKFPKYYAFDKFTMLEDSLLDDLSFLAHLR